eukprot:4657095-Prymnesium_polylepis.1
MHAQHEPDSHQVAVLSAATQCSAIGIAAPSAMHAQLEFFFLSLSHLSLSHCVAVSLTLYRTTGTDSNRQSHASNMVQ